MLDMNSRLNIVGPRATNRKEPTDIDVVSVTLSTWTLPDVSKRTPESYGMTSRSTYIDSVWFIAPLKNIVAMRRNAAKAPRGSDGCTAWDGYDELTD